MKEDSSPYQPAVIVRSILFDSRQPEAEMLMGLLAVAGQETGSTQLEFPVREEDRLWVQQVIRRENLKPGQYAVLAPGAGWPGKIWSAERFAELGDWLQQERGLGVVLAGSSSENALGVLVLSQMQHMPLSLMGQTSLGQIGALLESAALYVGNDSAILHIASSVGIPSVALFGPTYAEKWAPRGMQHRYLQHRKTVCQANCHPWHVEARCNRGQVCMKAITVAEVQQAIADVCMASGPKP
ncbi:MAG: hypothetical protein A2X46_05035 [Lentisphaerae bacterium GWF2_57_35]|nr:MAG: hypothetical protein A2X46_05035 [Lentisphaerae bacterium GWF2_57_35]